MDPVVPIIPNGNGELKRDLSIVKMLSFCVACVAGIAIISSFHPPSQWDIVNKVVDGLFVLITTLVGGLLTRHTGSK